MSAQTDALAAFRESRRETLRPWQIAMRQIAAETGFSLEDFSSKDRNAKLAAARQRVMHELRVKHGMTLPEIGRKLNRHHTSVLHGVRAHAERTAAEYQAPVSVSSPSQIDSEVSR